MGDDRRVFMTLQKEYLGNNKVFMSYLEAFMTPQKRYTGQ